MQIYNFGHLSTRHYIYVSKYVRIGGFFSEAKRDARAQKSRTYCARR